MTSEKIKVYVVGGDWAISQMYTKRKSLGGQGYELCDTIKDADIVQFIGGADVDPSFYGEDNLVIDGRKVSGTFRPADERDVKAWEASEGKLRVGICRGGQFLNVMAGGSMWQHVNGHALGRTHQITDCMFEDQGPLFVTSTHHQMMIPSKKGELIAYADGLASGHLSANQSKKPTRYDAEVVWYEEQSSLCFQPHPEYANVQDCTDYFFKLVNFFYKTQKH